LLQNGRLFESVAGNIVAHASILIHGERIEDNCGGRNRGGQQLDLHNVRRTTQLDLVHHRKGPEAIDLGGQTIVPGLIDTHVHYAPGGDDAMKLFSATGVTSVRDCGG